MSTEERSELEAIAEKAAKDLQEARGALAVVADVSVRERLDLLLSRAELNVTRLQQQLRASLGPDDSGATAGDFATVLGAIKAKWPDREKLALIGEMGTSGRYTSAQVRALLETFDFDDGRVEAAVRLYAKVTDPEHFFQALDAFSSSFKRDELRAKLNLA